MSAVSQIVLNDVFSPTLRGRASEAVSDGTIKAEDFRRCFEQHPEVLVQIMRLSGLDQPMGFLPENERDYTNGGADLARDIYTLSTMKVSSENE